MIFSKTAPHSFNLSFFERFKRDDNEAHNLMKFMWEQHPNVRLAESTLVEGGKVGVGLFAEEPISEGTFICWYWGHLVLADFTNICDPSQVALHSGLDNNILMFPDKPYNPIVKTPTKVGEDDLDRDLHLFMVTSNCCYGSYVKQRSNPSKCNARITDVIPPGWVCTDGYRDLNHFQSVIATPILCLLSTRDISKGEEIFVPRDQLPLVSHELKQRYQQGERVEVLPSSTNNSSDAADSQSEGESAADDAETIVSVHSDSK